MICRICLDDGTAATMTDPCQCTGTSRYIHRDCLDRYFTYYPDRMCRVCRSEMIGPATRQDNVLACIVLVALAIALTGSAVSFAAKGVLGIALLAVTALFVRNNLFDQTVAIGTMIVYVAFVNGGHPQAIAMMLSTLILVGALVTLFMYVPGIYVAMVSVIMIVFTYLLMMTLSFANLADSYALALFVSLLYMGWYAWIRLHPPMRLLIE